ncbi:MAG TPA: glycosyltransferase family 39 protein [Candidatus Acidoferrales bacterium]|nr:glycosyltransferase family 39 protein [Candidatus Acidoferrales bacterium]
MIPLIWALCALIFAARAEVAFTLPLTGDEAYYWEWSKHPAFGYVDHPPAVAWTIAAFAQFGNEPGLVRLGFVLCGIVAALALAGCATTLTGDSRAGAIAALALTVTPMASVAFGTASPDGPYLMFWCLALYFAARAFTAGRLFDYLLLGVALGGVLLSRIFGFALLFGLIAYALTPGERRLRRGGLVLSLLIALIAYTPFLLWNAAHQWVTFTFALLHRHQGEVLRGGGVRNVATLYLTQMAAYSPGIFVAVLVAAVRPRNALLGWTALPLLSLLTVLAFFRDVEIYWILGAFASLCAMLGVIYVKLEPRARSIWATIAVVPALTLLPLLFAVTLWPARSYEIVHRATGVQLHDAGPFEIFAFRPLAQDLRRLTADDGAIVMTDGYGLSSVLDFNAGVTPVVIGYDWQGREARSWYPSSTQPRRALFVDKVPLQTRPDFQRRLHLACAHVVDGGIHAYGYRGTPPRNFYFTWCDDIVPDGIAILRWETPG